MIKYRFEIARRYKIYIEEADKVYGEYFELEEIANKNDESVDIQKIKVQNYFLRKKQKL